jgi:branched-chain amino acid transport system substrate-binding protein
MAAEAPKRRKITRRDLVRTSTAAGVGGLAVGGIGGFLGGKGSSSETGGASAKAGGGEPLRVVLIAPMSGGAASWGVESKNGALLAIEEINANGGVLGRPLEYIEVDEGDWADPGHVRQVFSRAIDTQRPDVLVGPGAVATGPDYELTAEAGILYFHGNTREDWKQQYAKEPEKFWNVFQTDPTETPYGEGFALFLETLIEDGAWKPANGKRVSIGAGGDPYGTHIAKVFQSKSEELGWEVVSYDTVPTAEITDWGPILSKIRRQNPSVFFTTDFFPADNAALAKQWAAAPLPALLYQQYAPSEPEYLKLAGKAANGIIWSTVLGLQVDDFGNAFRERYREKYNQEPGWSYAGGVYDQVHLWAKAAAISGDPKDYRKVAKTVERTVHRGETGTHYLKDPYNRAYPIETKDPTQGQPQIIAQIQDGQQKVIYPEPYTNGKFQLPPWVS